MIKRRAILVLNDLEYEILHCGYRFTRKVDAKGRPISGIRGGDIWAVLESGENNRILSQMLLKSMPAAKGYIALLAGEDNQCVRRIEFEKAYVYSHGEQMQADAVRPMMTQVHITPLRLDVNTHVRLDRRWPETSGFHWQKYEEPEGKHAKKEAAEDTYTEVAELEIVSPLDENSYNKKKGMNLRKSYTIRVKNYTNGAPKDKSLIRWGYSFTSNMDNNEAGICIFKQLRGEQVEIELEDNNIANTTIQIFAYLHKQREEGEIRVYINDSTNNRRVVVYVHGTKSHNKRWQNNPLTRTALNRIHNTPRTDSASNSSNIHYFQWHSRKGISNGFLNDEKDRKKSSDLLVGEIKTQFPTADEIVLIGHSHGGNVAIQAADRLAKIYSYVYMITLATPAQNGISRENPLSLKQRDKIKHLALWNPHDKVDGLALGLEGVKVITTPLPSQKLPKMTLNSDRFTESPMTQNVKIDYDADLMDAHGFDVAAPLLIEKAIDQGRIKPWKRTTKTDPIVPVDK